MKTYLFLDLETSGLDPELDRIVEVGWALADHKVERLTDTEFTPVRPVGAALERIMSNEVVRKMHEETGLLKELTGPNADRLPTLAAVEESILLDLLRVESIYQKFLSTVPAEQHRLDPDLGEHMEFQLAGKNVHFDKAFVDRYMPRLSKMLSHRTFDESTVRSIFDALGLDLNVVSAENSAGLVRHRAGFDIELSLITCRFAINQLAQMLESDERFRGGFGEVISIHGTTGEYSVVDLGEELSNHLREQAGEN